jgi:Fe-S-cluster containining protein
MDDKRNKFNPALSDTKLVAKLKKIKPNDLDKTVHTLHTEAFQHIDCLTCANCCKTTSPIFYQRDIEKLARHLKIKPGAFIDTFLHIDEDKDYVLNTAPCPFLGPDNHCSVYEYRPEACKEYPHTNRKRIYQILNLTLKNAEICPAVSEVVEKLRLIY